MNKNDTIINEESFKKSVLDALGINFEINPSKFDELIRLSMDNLGGSSQARGSVGDKRNEKKNSLIQSKKFLKDKDNLGDMSQKISNFIDQVLKVSVNPKNKEKYETAQNKRKEWEKDLKTFTLDDLLANSKGFEIGKGVADANSTGYMNRNNDESIERKNNGTNDETAQTDASLDYKNIGSTHVFLFNSALSATDNLAKLLLFDDDTKNYVEKEKSKKKTEIPQGTFLILTRAELEGQKYPASFMEQILSRYFGGKLAESINQAVWDLDNGTYLSVKCLKDGKGRQPDFGSLNTLLNFDYKNKHLMLRTYNYNIVNLTKTGFNNFLELIGKKANAFKPNPTKGIKIYVCVPNPYYTGEFEKLKDKIVFGKGRDNENKKEVVAGEANKGLEDVINIFNNYDEKGNPKGIKISEVKKLINDFRNYKIFINGISEKSCVYIYKSENGNYKLEKEPAKKIEEEIKTALARDLKYVINSKNGQLYYDSINKTWLVNKDNNNKVLKNNGIDPKNIKNKEEAEKILKNYAKNKNKINGGEFSDMLKAYSKMNALTDNNIFSIYSKPIELQKVQFSLGGKGTPSYTCYTADLRTGEHLAKLFSQIISTLLIRDKFKYSKELKIEVPGNPSDLCLVWLNKTKWILIDSKNIPQNAISLSTTSSNIGDTVKEMFDYTGNVPLLFNY